MNWKIFGIVALVLIAAAQFAYADGAPKIGVAHAAPPAVNYSNATAQFSIRCTAKHCNEQHYQFSTLVNDTIDRTLKNRQNTLPEDMYPAALSDSDVGAATSPLRAVAPGTMLAKNLYMIGGAQLPMFADYAFSDNQAFGMDYVGTQAFWIGSTPNAVAYDPVVKDVVVNRYSAMAYSEKFSGNDYGIPVCTGDLNYTVYDDWTSCDALSNSRTDSHRVPVKFMGENWIISSMAAPSAALPSSTSAINGGQIKLAQEEKYGIINAGQTLQGNPFSVRVADISATTETVPAVAFDILDANMSMVGQIQVDPETNYTFTVSGTGTQVKISLGDTDFAAQTANVTLYSGGNSTNGVLGVGGMLYASGYYVRVSEVGVPTLEPPYSAILDILKGNKAIGQIQVSPGQTYTFTQSGTGKSIKIHVYRVAPGFTLNSKWAEMAIYSDEITLRDGARYNLVSSTDADKDFRVSLLWKNRDYAGAGSSTQADSLREVVVYDTDSFTKKTLKGDKFDFLKSQTAFTIMYKGLDK